MAGPGDLRVFELGKFIDAKDTVNAWCMAKVIQQDSQKSAIKVRYDGWSEKWDQTFSTRSSQIAPFRRHSELYTGQKKNAIREWAYSEEELDSLEEELNRLSELRTGDALETTQLLRGRLFTLVDCLLVNNYKSKREAERALRFMMRTIELIVDWMKASRENFPKYYEGKENPDLYLTDDKVAAAMAWPELLFTLKRLFGEDLRTSKFFKTSNFLLKDFEPGSQTNMKLNVSCCLLTLVNYFGVLGGFELCLEILIDSEVKVPLEFLAALPVFDLGSYISKSFGDNWVASFREQVFGRIQDISNKELKDLNKETFTSILQSTKKLLFDYDRRQDFSELIEKAELDLGLKLLKCPFMEKRLKGLNEIKEMIEKISFRGTYFQGGTRGTVWLKAPVLVDWILENKVVEQILDYSHVEMFKRISVILIFLAKNKSLSEELLEKVWESVQGKHDSLVISCYQALIELAPQLSQEYLVNLFQKIQEKPYFEYDSRFLSFLKDFSIKAIEVASFSRKETGEFAIPIFYNLMLDSSSVNLQKEAVECLGEVLKLPACRPKLLTMLEQFLDNLKQNHSVPQSLDLAMTIMSTLFSNRMSIPQREDQLKKLDQGVGGMVDLIIESLETYLTEAKVQTAFHEDPYKAVLVGKYAHSKHLKIRLSFLEFIMGSRVFSISTENFGKLWDIFVKKSFLVKDKELFFKWLQKVSKDLFSSQQTKKIFEDFFCNSETLQPQEISYQAYSCFLKMFLVVNYTSRNIEVRAESLLFRNEVSLIGFESLMNIFLLAENEKVVSQATIFIVNLNMRLGRALLSKKEEVWGEFVNTCLDYIELQKNHSKVVKRGLKLLLSFLDDKLANEEASGGVHVVYYGKTLQEPEYRKFYITNNSNIGGLRKKIAESYKKPVSSVIITIGPHRYDSYDDDIPLTTIKSTVISIEFTEPKKNELTPKAFLGTSKRVNDVLLELLSNSEESYSDLAWNLLVALPFNEKIQQQLKDLNTPLAEILDTQSLYRLLYYLMIIEKLTEDETWSAQFKEAGGVDLIISIYLDTDCNSKSSSLTSKYNSVMINLMEKFYAMVDRAPPPELITKLLDSLRLVADSCTEEDEETPTVVARNATKLLQLASSRDKSGTFASISSFPRVESLISSCLLKCSNRYFNTSMMNLLLELTVEHPQLADFFVGVLLDIIEFALRNSSCSETYWTFLSHLIKETRRTQRLVEVTHQLINELKTWRPEKSGKEQDYVMCGILKVLKAAITKAQIPVTEEIANLILHSCLFEIPTSGNKDPPKCKNSESRREAFYLLSALCQGSEEALSYVTKYLARLHEDPHWRTSRSTDWNYSPTALEKSETGFVGIKNLGCTCYMSSCIQQIFNVPSFREGILRAKDKSGESFEDSLLYQLQYMFSALENSDKQYINPKSFCKAFKDWEGRSVNVMEQMDVDEFFNTFMDRLENQLKSDSQDHIIKNHFGGLQVTELIGKDSCTHRSERHEPFLTLPVQVKNKKSLHESLESFVEGEVLEGDNAYQCDHCEAKVTALRRVSIKHLPNIFVVAMRRFDFDFDTMERAKVNDYCEFPLELDMEPYTQEGLERRELLKEKELAKQESKEFDKEIPDQKYPSEYYNYSLKGIVIHIGTAESGHYYSFIKDRSSEKWYEFNDTLVKEFNPEDIPAEAFGGEEKWSYPTTYGTSISSSRERFRNAYLLFYERSVAYMPAKEEENLKPITLHEVQGDFKDFQEVKEENERYWRCRSSFTTEYFDFVYRLLKLGRTDILRFATEFFLTIMIRSKDLSRLPSFVNLLKENLKNSPEVSEWLLETVTVEPVLKELILECPVTEKRRVILGVIHAALRCVETSQHDSFLKRLLNKLNLARKPYTKHYSQYFELIYRVCKLSPELFSANEILPRLISHIFEDKRHFRLFPEEHKHKDIFMGYDRYKPDQESRVDRFSYNDSGASYSYLIATLQLGTEFISSKEMAKLLEPMSMLKLCDEGNTKVGARAVGHLYATLCYENRDHSFNFIKVLKKRLHESDYDTQKPYLRQLTWMLKINDSFASDRIEFAMKAFLDQMRENKQYFKATELCLDYLFKVCSRITAVKEWISKKNKEVKWIESWLKETQYPTTSYMQPSRPSSMSIYKPKTVQWGSSQNYIARSNLEKLELLRKLMKGSIPDKSDDWDSDYDIPEEKLQPGLKVDVQDSTGKWFRAVIIHSIGELVYVKQEGPIDKNSKWVDVQSDQIAPEGAKLANTR